MSAALHIRGIEGPSLIDKRVNSRSATPGLGPARDLCLLIGDLLRDVEAELGLRGILGGPATVWVDTNLAVPAGTGRST